MSTAALRRPSVSQARKASIDVNPQNRSTMIMTSAQTTRDGAASNAVVASYANTYQLGPSKAINSCSLRKVIKDVLTEQLAGRTYSPAMAGMTKVLAEKIKERAKDLGYKRYKYVCLVALGASQKSDLAMASRFLWNPSHDTYADYTYKHEDMIASGVIYGVYLD